MTNEKIREAFLFLTTTLITDACHKLDIPIGVAPGGIMPLTPEMRVAGRAFPVRHYGSLDVILEAIDLMEKGEVLVIDDDGRTDRACVGDLTALEAQQSNVSGIVIWGCHRDTSELRKLDVPLFSYGRCPRRPRDLRPRPNDALTAARFGTYRVTQFDVVFGDEDGVVFVPFSRISDILDAANSIHMIESQQSIAMWEGRSLRMQLEFDEYLAIRKTSPDYTFSQHLKNVGGEVGE